MSGTHLSCEAKGKRPGPRLREVFVAGLLLAGSVGGATELTVTREDLAPENRGGWHAPDLVLPVPGPEVPVVDPAARGPALAMLRSLVARGQANGFDGILYDNRDRGHSRLDAALFPRLTHLRYGPELREEQADYGLATRLRLPFVVLGNSSTALVAGPRARSLPRFAMTFANAQAFSARLYASNHLYVYPEHRDYDAVDLFPANWPYQVISQGSSRSDRPFLEALAATLAAFQPETFAFLRDKGLVAPTLQMILRRSLAFVDSEAAYFAGSAHRPVLSGRDLRPERMVALANALTPADVPPLVQLSVAQESFRPAGGIGGMSEFLFTTPSAIARVWRGFDWEKSMIVSAENTEAPNGESLRFSWRLLQGREDRVTITPLDATGRTARITVQWHDRFTLPSGTPDAEDGRETSRVDIGVFALNGRMPSAPAIISIAFPTHQVREYAADAQGKSQARRLARIDYDTQARGAAFDPVLFWTAPWVDTAIRDAEGRISGWDRAYSDANRAPARVPHDPGAPLYDFVFERGRAILVEQPGPVPETGSVPSLADP